MKRILPLLAGVVLSISAFAQCTSVVAEYHFTGNALDSSGNNLNGTVNGATLVQDRFGNPNSAYQFDGVDDYILVGHSTLLNFGPNDDFSISMWIKPEITQNSTDGVVDLISKWSDNGAGNPSFPFAIRLATAFSSHTNGAVGSHRFDQSCSNHYFGYANSTPVNDLQWHHVVMVKDADSVRLYIDNTQLLVGYDVTSCSTSNTEPMYIGNRGGTFNQPDYYGTIDDIGIYDCALSPSEIGDLFTVSVNEVEELDNSIRLYPNPGNELILELSDGVRASNVTIIDAQGKLVMTHIIQNTEVNVPLDVEGLSNGIYLIHIETDKGVVTKKWIKN